MEEFLINASSRDRNPAGPERGQENLDGLVRVDQKQKIRKNKDTGEYQVEDYTRYSNRKHSPDDAANELKNIEKGDFTMEDLEFSGGSFSEELLKLSAADPVFSKLKKGDTVTHSKYEGKKFRVDDVSYSSSDGKKDKIFCSDEDKNVYIFYPEALTKVARINIQADQEAPEKVWKGLRYDEETDTFEVFLTKRIVHVFKTPEEAVDFIKRGKE